METEKHSQLGLANSQVDNNQVDTKIAPIPIHITTTASIIGVIAVFLVILCKCSRCQNLNDLYQFVCIQRCKPKKKQQNIEMQECEEWQAIEKRIPRDYGERVQDLIGESNELARHLNASTGRGLEKT